MTYGLLFKFFRCFLQTFNFRVDRCRPFQGSRQWHSIRPSSDRDRKETLRAQRRHERSASLSQSRYQRAEYRQNARSVVWYDYIMLVKPFLVFGQTVLLKSGEQMLDLFPFGIEPLDLRLQVAVSFGKCVESRKIRRHGRQ